MERRYSKVRRWQPWLLSLAWIPAAAAQPRAIDTQHSTLTVRVEKSGWFSALGHDHEISAPIQGGSVDAAASQVSLRTAAKALEVRDPGVSDKDRAQIQATMLGPEVLDAQRYPEIAFQSMRADSKGADSWSVLGELTLHGQRRPVTVEVREQNGHYLGTARFRQTEFGITPVKIGGGTIRVKDEVQIEFDIQLKASEPGAEKGTDYSVPRAGMLKIADVSDGTALSVPGLEEVDHERIQIGVCGGSRVFVRRGRGGAV